jgi:hypothetical protein
VVEIHFAKALLDRSATVSPTKNVKAILSTTEMWAVPGHQVQDLILSVRKRRGGVGRS